MWIQIWVFPFEPQTVTLVLFSVLIKYLGKLRLMTHWLNLRTMCPSLLGGEAVSDGTQDIVA